MRMTSDAVPALLALGLLVAVSPALADSVCSLAGFEKVSTGWMSKTSYSSDTWIFKTHAKTLDVMSLSATSLASLARLSAVKQFAGRYKKIYPPGDDNHQFVIKGMQVRTAVCSGDPWVQYSIGIQQMSWESGGLTPLTTGTSTVDPSTHSEASRAVTIID